MNCSGRPAKHAMNLLGLTIKSRRRLSGFGSGRVPEISPARRSASSLPIRSPKMIASSRGIAIVAVGTRVSSRAPRTEPYVRLSRIRLPPRVCDGEAIARPRVEDDRSRKPVVRQLRHPCPCDPILLAAKPQRAPPEVDNMVPEHVQCPRIGRHCVIVEVAADDVPQPLSLFGNWLMHAPPHLLFDHLELRLHAVSPGLPLDLEFALASPAADEGEAQEVEGLRLAEPAPLAAFRRKGECQKFCVRDFCEGGFYVSVHGA